MELENHEDALTIKGNLRSEGLPNSSLIDSENGRDVSDRPKLSSKLSLRDVELEAREEQITEDLARESLLDRVRNGDEEAKFLLGQFFFTRKKYEEARKWFEEIEEKDWQAKYQLAVMKFDGLGGKIDYESAVSTMELLANSDDPEWEHLIPSAQYNLGKAYYEGYGVVQSDEKAEFWWLLAAKDGDPDGSVKAQSTLGMFYSRIGENSYGMDKAYFWHQEATGNGSLESQAALGVMYNFGLGVQRNLKLSYQCFKSAAERGNIYAIGNIAFYYYKQKLYNNAVDFSQRVTCISDAETVAENTNCLLHYVKKGIALGCFIYGRCLYRGFGIKKNKEQALEYYSKAAEMDLDVAHEMQELMIQGHI